MTSQDPCLNGHDAKDAYPTGYEPPALHVLGSLAELTQGCYLKATDPSDPLAGWVLVCTST